MKPQHPETAATRAVLACTDATVRAALRDLSMEALGMDVVAEASDTTALERQVRRLEPDLVIVAWKLLAPGAGAVLRRLRGSCDGLRVVVLGPRPDTRREALAAGADAYISMVDTPDTVTGVLSPVGARSTALETNEPRGES